MYQQNGSGHELLTIKHLAYEELKMRTWTYTFPSIIHRTLELQSQKLYVCIGWQFINEVAPAITLQLLIYS